METRAGRTLVFSLLFFIHLSLLLGPRIALSASISDYKPTFRPGKDKSGELRIAIRSYRKDNSRFLLLVNPFSFETSIVKESTFIPFLETQTDPVRETPYLMALRRYAAPPYKTQNQGLLHAESPVEGMFLTVDLCPSLRPFEREFFERLAGMSKQNGKGTPVAIAITGKWLTSHADEFRWIVSRNESGSLAVTWVNHSLTHPYDPRAPLTSNFLLTPGTDFVHEVLETERLLLENGQLPSPFFRFPGLVSDEKLIKELKGLALIPIGSDAWLAKGEIPVEGSVILVHGNGNEPAGIKKVMDLLSNRHGIRLLPLGNAFSGEGK